MPCIESDGPQKKEASDEAMRLTLSVIFHPFQYSKVLMQLGYEPIPAVPGRRIFGGRGMILPNYFRYVNHIRKIDGFDGCFRGLAPKLVGHIFSIVLSEKIAIHLGLNPIDEGEDVDMLTDEELYVIFKLNLKRDVVRTVSGIIVAQPFRIISIRMMAQFIGRESLYRSVFGSVREIYRTEGICGFFSGLIPKLLFEVVCLVLTSSTVYLFNKYVVKGNNFRYFSGACAHYVFGSILYPLSVVCTCVTVSGSNLMAGQPPMMPIYKNWLDCFKDLQARNELSRGKYLFRRFAGRVVNTHVA